MKKEVRNIYIAIAMSGLAEVWLFNYLPDGFIPILALATFGTACAWLGLKVYRYEEAKEREKEVIEQ